MLKVREVAGPPTAVERFDDEDLARRLTDHDVEVIREIFQTPLTGSYNWDYETANAKIRRLYELGKRFNWNTELDIDWNQPPPHRSEAPDPEGFADHPKWKALSAAQKQEFQGRNSAQTLSQFLHGEQGALMTAACVTHSVPDATAKLYAATQTMDEARHVEVYAKYCDKIAIVYPMSLWLKALIDATLKSDRYEKVMIGMNMIVEGLALGAFNNMYRTTQCELLKKLTFNVMRDESRHVSFGHAYLGPVIAKLPEDEVEDLAEFAFQAVSILAHGGTGGTLASQVDPGFLSVLENSNIDPKDFFKGMAEAEAEGITQELPPGQIHSVKDLMLPALARVGLLTPTVRKKYVEAGIPIFEDLRVLQAMEGGHPIA